MKTPKTISEDKFATLRAANSSAEYRSVATSLRDDLDRLLREHSEAELARDQGILEGSDVTALRQRVITLATEIADLQLAIEEVSEREVEAERREQEADIHDVHAQGQRLGEQLGEEQRAFDAELLAVRRRHAQIDRLKERLRQINGRLEVHGHPELRIKAEAVRAETFQEGKKQTFPGLTRSGQRLDALLKDIGSPGQAIRINSRHRRLHGNNMPLPAA